jgi:flagellar motor switch/type III secretory pathway protein FliN
MAKKKVAPPTAAPDHLRDVMMKVTIELARTRMTLDEALALEESSVWIAWPGSRWTCA